MKCFSVFLLIRSLGILSMNQKQSVLATGFLIIYLLGEKHLIAIQWSDRTNALELSRKMSRLEEGHTHVHTHILHVHKKWKYKKANKTDSYRCPCKASFMKHALETWKAKSEISHEQNKTWDRIVNHTLVHYNWARTISKQYLRVEIRKLRISTKEDNPSQC